MCLVAFIWPQLLPDLLPRFATQQYVLLFFKKTKKLVHPSSICAARSFPHVCLLLECGQFTRSCSSRENRLPLSQHLSVANSTLVRGGTSCPPLLSMLEFALARNCLLLATYKSSVGSRQCFHQGAHCG